MSQLNLLNFYNQLHDILEKEDRAAAISFVLPVMQQRQLTIAELYEMILAPLLNNYVYPDDHTRIVKEHIRSSIIRSLIEACYPLVIEEVKKVKPLGLKVVVTCPSEEYHEIGARMAADFFELTGYEVLFTGANTPNADIVALLHYYQPHYIAISISNNYNLIKAKPLLDELHQSFPMAQLLLGGAAFTDEQHRRLIPYGRHVSSFESIQLIAQGAAHVIA